MPVLDFFKHPIQLLEAVWDFMAVLYGDYSVIQHRPCGVLVVCRQFRGDFKRTNRDLLLFFQKGRSITKGINDVTVLLLLLLLLYWCAVHQE